MSIKLKTLRLKNFLSIGNVEQEINFDRKDLTLILGENLDLGGDGSRNGTGKTSILQGLSYALFGSPINQIKKDNLINRTNGKQMHAVVEFTINDNDYQIVRGRKPNVLKFYVNNKQQSSDDNDAQGENKETQQAIERILGMSSDMFQHIVGLNSYTTPFLSMRVSDQRTIIEQLLGITLLSEKADAIKELNKTTKEDIQREEFRVNGVEAANKRITEQIDSLKKRQRLWIAKRDEDLLKLVTEYDQLQLVDIGAELAAHKDLAVWNSNKEKLDRYDAVLARQTAWRQKLDKEVTALQSSLTKLTKIDIAAELSAHSELAIHNTKVSEREIWAKELQRAKSDGEKLAKSAQKLQEEVHELEQHRCYACGQEFHDSKHTEVLEKKRKLLVETNEGYAAAHELWNKLVNSEVIVGNKPTTHYNTHAEAIKHSSEVDRISKQIEDKLSETDPYAEQLLENSTLVLSPQPKTHYDTEEAAFKHSSRVQTLLDQIQKKHSEEDPYAEQIAEMQTNAIQTVDFSEINRLTRLLQHQDYLLDLLTNKKSFVRKKIIEQNLSYLNNRLSHYLDRIGLPHRVVFQNDLSVEITELGRELDFDSLSRGERTRVILGLSFAFRDVWENLYQSVNVMFIDELMDSGMDTVGIENGLALLKDFSRNRNKSVWLVSHRDELTNRVNNTVKVVKENGFTSLKELEE
jgi:DNA repair exonuclease SbcCD ATPase subunit